MTILALCNIGSHDVALDGEFIHPARQGGKKLLVDFDSLKSRITLPIIKPSLDYICNNLAPKEHLHFVCYGTNQKSEKYKHTDTLYFANIVTRKLEDELGIEHTTIQASVVSQIDPSLYDEALDAFQTQLKQFDEQKYKQVFIILAGGTPAFNTALLLQGIRFYGDKLQIIYQPQSAEPLLLRINQQIKNAYDEITAINLIESFDFANAAKYLDRIGANKGIQYLINYATQRLYFNFSEAQKSLHNAIKSGTSSTRDYINKNLRHDLDNILDPETPVLDGYLLMIRELAWSAEIVYKQYRYADFLGRVYRFQEAVLRFLVEKLLQLPTDTSNKKREETQKIWNETISSDKVLVAYLENQNLGKRKLDWTKIKRTTLKALLGFTVITETENKSHPYYLSDDDERKFYQSVIKKTNELDGWIDLRHQTILGHGFQGVSKDIIVEHAPLEYKNNPYEALLTISNMLNSRHFKSPINNPYQDLLPFFSKHLKKEVKS